MQPLEAKRVDRAISAARHALEDDDTDAARWHDLGVLYQQRGSLAESRTALERAVTLDNSLASAHNNLGNTYNLLGELDLAIASYRRALAYDAGLAPAHANAAAALHLLGRHADALPHARAAAELDPQSTGVTITLALITGAAEGDAAGLAVIDALLAREPQNAPALAARAYVLLRMERFGDAVDAAAAGLAFAPAYGLLLETLGCGLRGLGRFDEAFAAFDRAIELGHDRAAILVLKAGGLMEIGAFADARATLERALDIAPFLATAWHALTEVRPFPAGDPAIATMETLLADAPQLRASEPRTLLHFSLGRVYHKNGSTEDAFRHFAAGNALKRATFAYDVAADERSMRATIAAYPAAAIARLRGASDIRRAPIFIVGMVRSGTTLIEQLLASHPDVFGAGERLFFDRALLDAPPGDLHAAGRRYLELLDTVAPPDRRVVDKLPSNFRHLAQIQLALPHARIIHCMRDPLDTCFSAYTTLFTGRQDFAFDLTELGRYYRAYATLMDHWHSVLPAGTLLDVQYETVVADLEGSARRILAFCDLPWNDALLRFHETQRTIKTASFHQARQPIYRSSIHAAERYRPHLQPLIDALAR